MSPTHEIAEGVFQIPRYVLFVAPPEGEAASWFGWQAAYASANDYNRLVELMRSAHRDTLWQIVDLSEMRVIASHYDCFKENAA